MSAERNPHADDSLLQVPLTAVTELGLRAPLSVLIAATALALACLAVTLNGLTFKTSRLDLLNPRSEYNQRWLAYLAEFGSRDDACIVVRSNEPAQLAAALDDLGQVLRSEPQYFESVFFQRDLSSLKAKALHYLPQEQVQQIAQQVSQATAALPRADEPADPAQRLAGLNDHLTRVAAATPEQRQHVEEQYARAAGMALAALAPTAAAAGFPGNSPHASATLSSLDALQHFEPQHLLADSGQLGFVLTKLVLQHGEPAPNSFAIARLHELIEQARVKHPHVWIGLTGMPVIEHDEMAASQFDMVWTSALSMALVLLLYLAAYGGLRHALLVNILLVLGTAYSFGFVTIVVGHLNILSAAFSAVLIGLGIDFAIHYVASYLNLRRQGCNEEDALLRTAVEVGPGVVTGGVTTAAAFFMAAMTDFLGVRELGLVAGGGILLCVLATVVVLPPLVLVVDRRWPLTSVPAILPAGRWFQFPLQQPRLVMAACLAGTLVLGAGTGRLRYDHNLLNLQPRHLESADIERQLLTRLDDSVWFAVSLCSSRDEVYARKAAFEQLPLVAKTEEIASLIPDSTPQHAAAIEQIGRQLAVLPEKLPAAVTIDAGKLLQEIARAQELLARDTPYETPATALLGQLRGVLSAMPPSEAAARLAASQQRMLGQIINQLAPLRGLADPLAPRLQDLPPELTDRFIGRDHSSTPQTASAAAGGMYLLKVYAKGDIWNMEQLKEFVHAVESVDRRVTGHPVQTYYASRHMQQSYIRAGLYALAAVLVLLWIDFRSLAHSLLAMVPVALGFAQMCGVLGWLDLALNPANMIVLPLMLGIGVDHGVHLVHLWRQQRGRFALGDAPAVALLLTAATTTASFGALILARHQGLQSLGQVLTLGVTTCLASSIVFFPALLTWLDNRRSKNHDIEADSQILLPAGEGGQPPADWVSVHKEAESSSTHPTPLNDKALSDAADKMPVEPVVPEPQPAIAELATSVVPPVAINQETPPALITPALPIEPEPLLPAPVTEEEIAALLESAFHPRLATSSDQREDEITLTDDSAASLPRRRNLPRRSDAA